jgi:hypothetical protein
MSAVYVVDQALLKAPATATGTSWMSAAFVAVQAFLPATATAMGTSWMSAAFVEAQAFLPALATATATRSTPWAIAVEAVWPTSTGMGFVMTTVTTPARMKMRAISRVQRTRHVTSVPVQGWRLRQWVWSLRLKLKDWPMA